MEKNSTLDELALFTRNEKKYLKSLGLISVNSGGPSPAVIQNILNYSKALSVRKTKGFGFIEFVLN